jgi:hypothetical protein
MNGQEKTPFGTLVRSEWRNHQIDNTCVVTCTYKSRTVLIQVRQGTCGLVVIRNRVRHFMAGHSMEVAIYNYVSGVYRCVVSTWLIKTWGPTGARTCWGRRSDGYTCVGASRRQKAYRWNHLEGMFCGIFTDRRCSRRSRSHSWKNPIDVVCTAPETWVLVRSVAVWK